MTEREPLSVEVDDVALEHAHQCGASFGRGVDGYIEKLLHREALTTAADRSANRVSADVGYYDAAERELFYALAEDDRSV